MPYPHPCQWPHCSVLLALCSSTLQAANPGCVLEDFVRWYSPPDWSAVPLSPSTHTPPNHPPRHSNQPQPLPQSTGMACGTCTKKSAASSLSPLSSAPSPCTCASSRTGYLSVRMTSAGECTQGKTEPHARPLIHPLPVHKTRQETSDHSPASLSPPSPIFTPQPDLPSPPPPVLRPSSVL